MAFLQISIMKICLNHQLFALTIGVKIIKLKYDNRVHNISTLDLKTDRCHIINQNHGYAIKASTLSDN